MAEGKRPIFIHSLFRTGSTYIWNKFRKNGGYYCYYEPLHPVLAKMTEDNIENLMTKDFDSVNHPSLSRYYLYEYAPLLEKGIPGVPYFKKSFSFDEFCNNDNSPALKKYLDHLIYSAGGKTPLLQFNRTAFRVKWFKQTYPDSLNIYLVRQPRDQWQSYFEIQQKTRASIFFVMDLLTASVNKKTEYFKSLSQAIPLVEYHDHSFEKEEKFYQFILDTYPGEERYFIFYYTWFRALIENARHSDFVLNMNLLSREPIYREEVIGFFKKNDIEDIGFDDSRVREYPSYPLSQEVMQEIEKKNRQLLLHSLPAKEIDLFFKKISSRDKKYFQFHKKSFLEDKSKGLLPFNPSRAVDEFEKKHILLSLKFSRLEEENSRVRNSINNKDKELVQKDQELIQRLKEKDEQLMRKDNELKQLLEQKDQQLALKDLQLIKKDEQLAQKDRVLKHKLGEKDEQIAQKDERLMRKDNELKQLLEQKDQQLALKDLQLVEKDEQLLRKEEEEEECDKLKQELIEQEYLLREKEKKLAEKELQIDEKSRQFRQNEAYIQMILNSYTYRAARILSLPFVKFNRMIKNRRLKNAIAEKRKKT